MVHKDLCLAKIEKSWDECYSSKKWVFCSDVLRSLVKYLSVHAKIPTEFNPVIKKRIAFLEKKLDSVSFSDSRKIIDAIKYARQRIDSSGDGPQRGGKFKAAISSAERDRVTGALDSGFLAGLKRPVVAFSDTSDDPDEPGGNDQLLDHPRME